MLIAANRFKGNERERKREELWCCGLGFSKLFIEYNADPVPVLYGTFIVPRVNSTVEVLVRLLHFECTRDQRGG